MSRKFGMNSNRFTFTLNVDFAILDASLGCIPLAKNFGVIAPKNTTKIEDILGTGSTYTFLDPLKKTKHWVLTMKDAISKVALPQELGTSIRCWWCHDTFKENPLGCPIKLVKHKHTKTYYSHANKKNVVIETRNTTTGIEDSKTIESYYLTKGYLCCWECLLAYAESMKLQTEFRESVQLVYHMFETSGREGKITPAPHYTLKQEYGGPLSQQDYKGKHDTYQVTGNSYIRMVPFGELFEITSKF
jgi:hypothetical protein